MVNFLAAVQYKTYASDSFHISQQFMQHTCIISYPDNEVINWLCHILNNCADWEEVSFHGKIQYTESIVW